MAGIVEGADGVGDVGRFGLRELDKSAELSVDVAVEIYQAIVLFPYTHLRSLHRLDHGFDELLFGFGDAVFRVELSVDFWDRARPVDVGSQTEVLKRNKTIYPILRVLGDFRRTNKNTEETRL